MPCLVPILEVITLPLAGLAGVVLVVFILRNPLSGLIDRIQGAKFRGLEVDAGPQQQEEVDKSDYDPAALKKWQGLFQHPMISAGSELVREELESEGVRDHKAREDLLISSLVSVQVALAFERTYMIILGSQLRALRGLASSVPPEVEAAALRGIYEEASRQFPSHYQGFGFDSWLGFLVDSHLVLVEGEQVSITIRGVEFLKYLIERRYSDNRYG